MLLVNTAVENVKQKHATKGKLVSIAIADENNMYDHVTIQGRVADQMREGTQGRVDKQAHKYTGAKRNKRESQSEQRVIIKIETLRIV